MSTLHYLIVLTWGLLIFEKLVLRLALIKYVWFIFFAVFGPMYGLLDMYGLFKIYKKCHLQCLLANFIKKGDSG